MAPSVFSGSSSMGGSGLGGLLGDLAGLAAGGAGGLFNMSFLGNLSEFKYTTELLLCGAPSAVITCTAQPKTDIFPDICGYLQFDLTTFNLTVGSVELNVTNPFSLSGCDISAGQICAVGCFATCTCAQPDGSPCGMCSQFLNGSTPLNVTLPSDGESIPGNNSSTTGGQPTTGGSDVVTNSSNILSSDGPEKFGLTTATAVVGLIGVLSVAMM